MSRAPGVIGRLAEKSLLEKREKGRTLCYSNLEKFFSAAELLQSLYILMTTGPPSFGKVSWHHGLTIFMGRQGTMTRNIRRLIAMALPILAFALMSSSAMAQSAASQSYTGNWPATVTESQRDNGTDCITLTDDGSYGFTHSGEAVLNGQQNPYGGYFTVVNGLMTVTFTYPSGEGDCCSYQVFTARASNGHIGKGVFNYFGITDVGLVAFGKKNGCS
jgi:hypothetical protein